MDNSRSSKSGRQSHWAVVKPGTMETEMEMEMEMIERCTVAIEGTG